MVNIFVLDLDPEICAQYHCDKHVVKMVSEYGQLLSTAHWILSEREGGVTPTPQQAQRLFKPAYKNHPSSVWARECRANYYWLYDLFCATSNEFFYRYHKKHMSFMRLKHTLRHPPANLKGEAEPEFMTEFPQCMPDEYKDPDPLQAYKLYYAYGKFKLLQYRRRQAPQWIEDLRENYVGEYNDTLI